MNAHQRRKQRRAREARRRRFYAEIKAMTDKSPRRLVDFGAFGKTGGEPVAKAYKAFMEFAAVGASVWAKLNEDGKFKVWGLL